MPVSGPGSTSATLARSASSSVGTWPTGRSTGTSCRRIELREIPSEGARSSAPSLPVRYEVSYVPTWVRVGSGATLVGGVAELVAALSGMRGQTSRPVVLPGRSGGRRRLGAPRSCCPAAPCQVRRLRCADLPRYGHPSWRPGEFGPDSSLARCAYAAGLGRAKGKNIPLNPGVTTSLLVRPQGFGPALFRACSLPTTHRPCRLPYSVGHAPRERIAGHPSVRLPSPRPISLGGASGRLTAAPTAERLSCRGRLLSNSSENSAGVARKQPGVNVACSTVPVVFASCALPCTMAQGRAGGAAS